MSGTSSTVGWRSTGGTRVSARRSPQSRSQGAVVAAGFSGKVVAADAFAQGSEGEVPGADFTIQGQRREVAEDCRRVVAEVLEQHGRLDSSAQRTAYGGQDVMKMTERGVEPGHRVNSRERSHVSGGLAPTGSSEHRPGSSKSRRSSRTPATSARPTTPRPSGARPDKSLAKGGSLPAQEVGQVDTSRAHGQCGEHGRHTTPDGAAHPESIGTASTSRSPHRFGSEEIARVVHFLAADAACTSPDRRGASMAGWTCSRSGHDSRGNGDEPPQ